MKYLRNLLNNAILTGLFFISLFLFVNEAFANEDGVIEIIYAPDYQAVFDERKSDISFSAGLNVDMIIPDKFRSRLDSGTYDQVFDSDPLPLIQVEMGPKLNTRLGGFSLNGLFGYGEVSGRDLSGLNRKLIMQKMGASLSYTLDTLFDEPYLAPYASVSLSTLKWEESRSNSGKTETNSGETDVALGISAGLLIQLNWIDPQAAIVAQNTSGLENTYLDLYLSQHNTSNSVSDANFETDVNFGAGLKLEF